jgi:hypothetical protein
MAILGYVVNFGPLLLVIWLLSLPFLWFASGTFYTLFCAGAMVIAALVIHGSITAGYPPLGRILTEEDSAEFLKEIERIRVEVGGPKLDSVTIGGGFSISVMTECKSMRLGQVRHLVIGLPVMLVLSPEDVTVLAAHELAFHSGQRDPTIQKLSRLEEYWRSSMDTWHSSGKMRWSPLCKLSEWYLDHYSPMTHVLRKQAWLDADQAAAETLSGELLTKALVRSEVEMSHRLEPYVEAASDADHLYSDYVRGFRAYPRERVESIPKTLEQALVGKGDPYDADYWLRSRLAGLGLDVESGDEAVAKELAALATPIEESSAEQFLGDRLDDFIADVDEQWFENSIDVWN